MHLRFGVCWTHRVLHELLQLHVFSDLTQFSNYWVSICFDQDLIHEHFKFLDRDCWTRDKVSLINIVQGALNSKLCKVLIHINMLYIKI